MEENQGVFESQAQEPQIDLREYWIVVLKRKWTIMTFFVILVTSVAIGTLRQPKIYQATSSIIIDTVAPEVLSGVREVVDMGTGGYWTNKEFYETQYKILQSRALAKKVVNTLGLAADLKFLGLDKIDDPAEREKAVSRADPEGRLVGKMTVQPVKDSRVVLINIEDTNPQFAALLANAVADAYIELNLEHKLEATRTAANWLAEQLRDLKEKMEKTEMSLYDFKKDNDILSVSLEDHQNMTGQRLRALNETLSKIEAQRIELEAKRRYIYELREGKQNLDSIEQILSSPLIQGLKTEYFKARSAFLEVQEKYGEKHPKFHVTKSQLDMVKANIDREVEKILSGLDSQYAMVVETERSLKRALEETKGVALGINKKEIDYNKLKREADNNSSLYGMVLKRLKETDLTGLLKSNNVRRLDAALVPKAPVKPKVKFNMLLAAIIGLMGGIGLAFFFEHLDNTIRTQEDIERTLGLAFLGFIPSIRFDDSAVPEGKRLSKDLYVYNHPKSNVAESCRSIRTNIMFVTPDKPVKNLLITSAGPQEGKSITAISVAISMALSGSRTVLVDTDMRRPRIHRAFGVENDRGISSCVVGEVSLDDAIQPSGLPNLDILACGPLPPNPAELIHTEKFRDMTLELSRRYDKVIYDSPPVIAVTDAVIHSKFVDGVILVIKSAKSTKDMVKQAKKHLVDVNARIIGAILNDLDIENREYSYYYYYYYRRYGYYYGEREKEKAQSA
ncbi:MAG: polysaccharide biosynthesis tyrosine autokinase [Deltaproteobacteria bacterium]|nr:polysaccharide biosynthesis tyrosine autokinase [Deltaproteobacteria bacterium]